MWPHRHQWTRWLNTSLRQLIDGRDGGIVSAQRRHCRKCGLEEVRTI